MQKLITTLIFCLFVNVVHAQTFEAEKPVVCDSTRTVIKFLTERYNEKHIWVGKSGDDDSYYGLLVNMKTGSWTLLQYTKDIACILGAGSSSKLQLPSDT